MAEEDPARKKAVVTSVLAHAHPVVVRESVLECWVPQDSSTQQHSDAGHTKVDAAIRSMRTLHAAMALAPETDGCDFPWRYKVPTLAFFWKIRATTE